VYLEDHGAGDGDITITVEGAEYTTEANYDLDGDGVDDTVAIMTDEGFLAYVDEDADGRADVLQHVNSDGVVTDQARFSPDSGAWVPEQPQQHDNDLRPNGDSMVVDTPDGKRAVGPATEDTNNDGRPDTAIVPTANGTMLATDSDGDGTADQLVEITADGAVTVSQHSGGGEWTVLQQGELDSEGQFTASGADSTDDATWRFDPPEQQVADHADCVDGDNDSGNPLNQPVIEAVAAQACYAGYHIQAPASRIRTAVTTNVAIAPRRPPSRDSPTPASMIRCRMPATR